MAAAGTNHLPVIDPDDRAALRSAPERPMNRALRLLCVLSVVVLVGGCVSLTPAQQDRAAEVQRFADATTQAYGMMPVRVTVQASNRLGIGGVYRQGNLYLSGDALDSGHLTALAAHELGHYLLGHEPISGVSMAEFVKAQERRELDANAKAVEILMRVRGMPRAQAVRTMVVYLRSAQNAQSHGTPNAPGHRPAAEEIADLIARFPETPVDTPQVVRASISPPPPLVVPIWKPGDQWTFWSDSPRGSGTYTWSVDREQTIDGTEYYVIASSTSQGVVREFFYQKSDLAWRMLKVNGRVESSAEPAQLRYVWPLVIGSTWEQTVTLTTMSDGKSSKEINARSCRVTGEEAVTVTAGIYRAIKTECRDTTTGELVSQLWYAPEAKHWVKEWTKYTWGVQEREVMSMRVR